MYPLSLSSVGKQIKNFLNKTTESIGSLKKKIEEKIDRLDNLDESKLQEVRKKSSIIIGSLVAASILISAYKMSKKTKKINKNINNTASIASKTTNGTLIIGTAIIVATIAPLLIYLFYVQRKKDGEHKQPEDQNLAAQSFTRRPSQKESLFSQILGILTGKPLRDYITNASTIANLKHKIEELKMEILKMDKQSKETKKPLEKESAHKIILLEKKIETLKKTTREKEELEKNLAEVKKKVEMLTSENKKLEEEMALIDRGVDQIFKDKNKNFKQSINQKP